MNHTFFTQAIAVVGFSFAISIPAYSADQHFHPKGKMPSKHTQKLFEQARATLPFTDKQDFAEQEKGFIAAPKSKKIMADAGHVAWDMERYEFLADGDKYNSIHPCCVSLN